MADIEVRCAQSLRELRKRKGLTLRECEALSEGKFKSVVLGSYERGTRAISLERLQELADFYEVPIEYFFSPSAREKDAPGRIIFDLRKIKQSQYHEEGIERIKAFLSHIARVRSDWNGEYLTIRRGDGELLNLLSNDEEILEKLQFHHFIYRKSD